MSHLVALLVSGHTAHCLDERVPGVVHSSLDALVQGPAVGGDLVPQSGVDGRRQSRGHAVVVLPQVGEVRATTERINPILPGKPTGSFLQHVEVTAAWAISWNAHWFQWLCIIELNAYFGSTVSLENHLHEWVHVHVSQVFLFLHISVQEGCEAET